jgi:hypothetical protein
LPLEGEGVFEGYYEVFFWFTCLAFPRLRGFFVASLIFFASHVRLVLGPAFSQLQAAKSALFAFDDRFNNLQIF